MIEKSEKSPIEVDMSNPESNRISPQFALWAKGFAGCDGGDIGSPSTPSIWFCGLEWGGGHDENSLSESISSLASDVPYGYDHEDENTAYIFNRQIMKLISAMHGGNVNEYEKFVTTLKPFVRGQAGFFKMNLFPIAFKNTDHGLWKTSFSNLTGIESKQRYLEWCREERFPILRSWVATYRPRAVICFGKSYSDDFKRAFSDLNVDFKREDIGGRELSWAKNSNGTLVAICPFPVNRNGLNSNALLQGFGSRLGSLADIAPLP